MPRVDLESLNEDELREHMELVRLERRERSSQLRRTTRRANTSTGSPKPKKEGKPKLSRIERLKAEGKDVVEL